MYKRQPLKTVGLAHIQGARQQIADLDRDAVAIDHHGALGHRQVVGEDMDGVVLGRFQFDDGAAAKPQYLVCLLYTSRCV